MKLLWQVTLALSVAAALMTSTLLSVSAGDGRYKKGPNGECVWDARDNGPDQCRPAGEKPKGRYKLDGKRCYWEPNDSGPNQCEPPKH